MTEIHYVVKRGTLMQPRGPLRADGTRVPSTVYPQGSILPPEVGEIEAAAHPHCVEIRPGPAPGPVTEPVEPLVGSPVFRPPQPQATSLSAADIEAIGKVVARESVRVAAEQAGHDRAVGPEGQAARDRVEADAAAKAEERRPKDSVTYGRGANLPEPNRRRAEERRAASAGETTT
mgnify:FL=1